MELELKLNDEMPLDFPWKNQTFSLKKKRKFVYFDIGVATDRIVSQYGGFLARIFKNSGIQYVFWNDLIWNDKIRFRIQMINPNHIQIKS